jgi:dCMP deaminase
MRCCRPLVWGEVEQTVVYSTLKPCFGCLKELLQAKVRAVRYLHEWPREDPALRAEYLRLLKELPDGVRR